MQLLFCCVGKDMEMIKIKDFWEGEAQIYDEAIKEELKGKFAPQWKKLILDNSPKADRLKVLDIGTGPGFFPVLLAKDGHDVTGIDVTENMIKWAKHNAENCGVEATLLTMDTHKLDFEDNSFDVIVNRNVTWTLENPRDAYKEWMRVLKPGGSLIIFDACWYLWNYDKDLEKIYRENEKRVKEKYGRRIHQHTNPDDEKRLGEELFMSDKRRPGWDLVNLIDLGFKEVMADVDITELVWDEMNKEVNGPTPQFMIVAKK